MTNTGTSTGPSGDDLKASGMAKVLTASFRDKVHVFVATLAPGKYTGEAIRLLSEEAGIFPETNNNAWGAVINGLRGRVLVPTGVYVKPSDPSSHSRMIQVYEKV